MSYTIRHLFGAMEQGHAAASEFDILYDELARADGEHTDVSVSHAGWSLSVYPSGLVVFENVEDDAGIGPRHLRPVPRDKVLQLWHALAKGNFEEIEREGWQPGYGQ